MQSVPDEHARSFAALKAMFDDYSDPEFQVSAHQVQRYGHSYPTNPQAEVLVFDDIDPDNIEDVVVSDQQSLSELRSDNQSFKATVDQRYFGSRGDYRLWKKPIG